MDESKPAATSETEIAATMLTRAEIPEIRTIPAPPHEVDVRVEVVTEDVSYELVRVVERVSIAVRDLPVARPVFVDVFEPQRLDVRLTSEHLTPAVRTVAYEEVRLHRLAVRGIERVAQTLRREVVAEDGSPV